MKKTFILHRQQDYHDQTFTLQMNIMTFLLIMAIFTHHVRYMSQHPRPFLLEMLAIVASSLIIVGILSHLRGWNMLLMLLGTMPFVAFIFLCIELGGWLDLESTKIGDNVVWSATILFILEFLFFFFYAMLTGDIIHRSGELVLPGLFIAFFGAVILNIIVNHSRLFVRLARKMHLTSPPRCLAMALLVAFLTCLLILSIMILSMRVGGSRGILRLFGEGIIVSVLMTPSILLICRDRDISIGPWKMMYIMISIIVIYYLTNTNHLTIKRKTIENKK